MESNQSENSGLLNNKSGVLNIWRPSIASLVNTSRRRKSSVYSTMASSENAETSNDNATETSLALCKPERSPKLEAKKDKRSWGTIVSVVLVEAKGLPNIPDDGSSHNLYCKIRLGSQTLKSKRVTHSQHPEWMERFKLHLHNQSWLKISLWEKGKQKNFMGSCEIDLSCWEMERTHEIWKQLDDAYGFVHLSITMCDIRTNNATCNGEVEPVAMPELPAIYSLRSDWNLVGQLQVRVLSARGLNSRWAHCNLELDNERVQTHSVRVHGEHTWNKSYVFNIYDVASTLDLKVYDDSLVNSLRNDSLGRVSIPLLRIHSGEPRWYALKDRTKRGIAKGNCPRVQLEITIHWNPIKAAAKIFSPKEVKYIKKPPKFDISLVYKNLEFVRDTYVGLAELNENFKRLFEWENQQISFAALVGWLLFWYHFRPWMAPLLLLIPFFYFWICNRHQQEKSFMRGYGVVESGEKCDGDKGERSLSNRITDMPEMTQTISDGTEYLASLSEKLYNLASFKLPFLSYLAILMLCGLSTALYLIPFNYLMMALGIYKFTRKYQNPNRVLNNDLIDFISRIPDTETLKDWKELSVPEPGT